MSDTYRRYRAIKQAIMQFYQPRPTGQREKQLNTLVALICGLVGGKHAHLSSIADHAPSTNATQESLIRRFRRFLQHDAHTLDSWFVPVAQRLLKTLAVQPIELVMDGSVVGRGCLALMVRVVYHGRALPVWWVVVAAPKGHFPDATHRALLACVQQMLPAAASVTCLGDGAFDGPQLQADLQRLNGYYVCRTAANMLVTTCGGAFHIADLEPKRGAVLALPNGLITARPYGPVNVLAVWEQQFTAPRYLLTNMSDLDAAVKQYKNRAHIETFFSDQKSRGFHIHKSHLSDPARLRRLLIAACLAYLWLIYLGVCALDPTWMARLPRQDRCDLSLFRLGLRLLARCLKEHVPIPTGFLLPVALPTVPVRTVHTPVT